MKFVLLTFNDNLFNLNHKFILTNSSFTTLHSISISEPDANKSVSCAKRTNLRSFDT